SGKVRLTKAAIQSQPGRRLDLILNIGRKNTSGGFFDVRRAEVGRALGVIDQAERLAILLREAVDACAQIVSLPGQGERKLSCVIIGGTSLGCRTGKIQRAALVICAVEVIERRKRWRPIRG